MKHQFIITLSILLFISTSGITPALAGGGAGMQGGLGSSGPAYAPPAYNYGYPGVNYGYNPYAPRTVMPYGVPYQYGGGVSPYGVYNGVPINSAPQLIGGGYYGLNLGGTSLHVWRAPSGYYYPWAGGYGYSSYPIFVVPPGSTSPTQTLPPISTIVSDLDEYLDKAKEKGKIDEDNFVSLKRRANDLLSKEKSLSYEAGGTLDPDQESDIRRDVDELSGEVARRVKP
jgi:hypothetical protein